MDCPVCQEFFANFFIIFCGDWSMGASSIITQKKPNVNSFFIFFLFFL